jgi:hypothetical protein
VELYFERVQTCATPQGHKAAKDICGKIFFGLNFEASTSASHQIIYITLKSVSTSEQLCAESLENKNWIELMVEG